MNNYQVVDRNGEPVSHQTFDSERKAYEALNVYRDNCEDIARPMKVVRAPEPRNYGQCSVCRDYQVGARHQHVCE